MSIYTFAAGAEIVLVFISFNMCSAKDKKVSDILNGKIKGREDFRPLAPVLLEKDLTKFL